MVVQIVLVGQQPRIFANLVADIPVASHEVVETVDLPANVAIGDLIFLPEVVSIYLFYKNIRILLNLVANFGMVLQIVPQRRMILQIILVGEKPSVSANAITDITVLVKEAIITRNSLIAVTDAVTVVLCSAVILGREKIG